jgi:hypothetical protein
LLMTFIRVFVTRGVTGLQSYVTCNISISRKGNQQVNINESERDTILSRGLGDLPITHNPH